VPKTLAETARDKLYAGTLPREDLCLPLILPFGLMPPAAGIRDAVHRRAAPSPLCPDSAAAQSEAWVRLSPAINVSASRCSSRRTSTRSPRNPGRSEFRSLATTREPVAGDALDVGCTRNVLRRHESGYVPNGLFRKKSMCVMFEASVGGQKFAFEPFGKK